MFSQYWIILSTVSLFLHIGITGNILTEHIFLHLKSRRYPSNTFISVKRQKSHILILFILCLFLSFFKGKSVEAELLIQLQLCFFIIVICSHKEMLIDENDNGEKSPQLSCLPTIFWWY